jgi:FKBP-type peptidyl-prolyl cis-trans isomerase
LSFSILALVAGLFLVSCGNADYRITSSGVKYNVFGKGNGKKVMPGQWIKLHYTAAIGDSVMVDTYNRIPAYGQYDTSMKDTHDFIDFLGELKIGDSVVFLRSVDTLQKRGYLQFNDVFKAGQVIKGTITILGLFPSQEAVMEDQQKETILEKEREIAGLEKYLKEQKVEGFIKTKSGIFIKLDKQGDGPKADSGFTVTVNYTGTLKNGAKFDSNVDTAFGHVGPFDFVAGAGGVIAGWDEAITYFNKGGKGKVYIPAMLGYGANANGDKLPAFSDLVFDIEVLDVKVTAKPEELPHSPTRH